MNSYVTLQGSEKSAPAAQKIETLNPDEIIGVTVKLARGKSFDEDIRAGRRYSRIDFASKYGVDDESISAVQEFAARSHLSVENVGKAESEIQLRGTVRNFESAFNLHLANYFDPRGIVFRGRSGEIKIPEQLRHIITGVFGLDNRPHASPKFQAFKKDGHFIRHSASPLSFYPNQVAQLYGFPSKASGNGESIGLIELGGGYRVGDLNDYFSSLRIAPPKILAVSVDGATNNPTTADSADGEVMLDIEVAGSVATSANIVVYFGTNTDKGFLDAVTKAVHGSRNAPTVISISWGSPEKAWTQQALTAFDDAFKSAALLGVTVCVAAGDRGSSDGVADGKLHVDFPAASPFVLACGGTRLETKGGSIVSETVWHESSSSATGGGVSDVFPLPTYQQSVGVPRSIDTGFVRRGLPDVAGDADPETGYNVVVDGQEMVIGGTSAVAPLMAALVALVNEGGKQTLGFFNDSLYTHESLCRDIVHGNNITTTTGQGYSAAKGWDACTGLGVPSSFPKPQSGKVSR